MKFHRHGQNKEKQMKQTNYNNSIHFIISFCNLCYHYASAFKYLSVVFKMQLFQLINTMNCEKLHLSFLPQ